MDIFRNRITGGFIHGKFATLAKLVRQLPYSDQRIKADLQDARDLPLQSQSVDFAITSPPYINVFNYHHNYRRSVEVLGWDPLRVARSEIGSNRANRGNRFYTVIQYCIDMANALQELARVLRPDGRAIFILGYESKVLGAPFYNANIIEKIACSSEMFDIVLRQQRVFTNRFGESIREDILNLQRAAYINNDQLATTLGRSIAVEALDSALATVSQSNQTLLLHAISRIDEITGTPFFNGRAYADYQTREKVMMVKQEKGKFMSNRGPDLPTPHLDKLKTLQRNLRLPAADRPRVRQALQRYQDWIKDLEGVRGCQKGSVQELVDATNQYKRFIELELIFDSPEDFLYRQKGQLKLDNTILAGC